ncbi:hypothetical protein D915_010109 [Fasciola hepatica]|uniref:Uncharacterized protein n=1 Tax=Fasciola hepatica TaxID=6192 RepID=A0A4E0QV49_FASHE|nr:hypothetical protein D915_010109 [Fasciola hepatica]
MTLAYICFIETQMHNGNMPTSLEPMRNQRMFFSTNVSSDEYDDHASMTDSRDTESELVQNSKIYLVLSFVFSVGVCDDEQEACAQGCGYDAKNQFFCHRTCLAQSQTCEELHSAKCNCSIEWAD